MSELDRGWGVAETAVEVEMESELRHRRPSTTGDAGGGRDGGLKQMTETEDSSPPAETTVVDGGKPRKKTWTDLSTRLLAAFVMLTAIFSLVWTGHIAISTLVVLLQIVVYGEVVNLGSIDAKEKGMPWFKRIMWGFFASTQYFIYGKSILAHFEGQGRKFMDGPLMMFLVRHHSFVSFCIYCFFCVAFVLSLQPKLITYQFGMYARAHIAIVIVIGCANFMILNVKMGMIWWFYPAFCVGMNDSFAYIFGRMFGRTTLTALSPKKTWEGFVLGGITTMITGFYMSRLLSTWEFMTCPKPEFTDCNIICRVQCTPAPIFCASLVTLPEVFGGFSFTILPVQIHGLVIAFFASVIAPFGGFFASGAKRAFKVKDFGSIIPGHGGILDRVDCQLVMAVFTYVYVINFVMKNSPDVEKILSMVSELTNMEQVELLVALEQMLAHKGVNVTEALRLANEA